MRLRTRRDHARLHRFQPGLESLERRELLSWAPELMFVNESRPNNLITQAQDVGPVDFGQGVQVKGAVATGTDVGFYQFEIDEAQDVTLRLAGTGIASLYQADTFAPSGYQLLLQLNAGSSQSINLLAGSYEVAVSGFGDRYFSSVLADSGTAGTTGPYGLTITSDNPGYDTNVPVPIVRTDIPAEGYGSSPLSINLTLTQPLDLVHDYVTILDSQQNDLSPNVAYQPAVNDLVITPQSALDVGRYQIVGYDAAGDQILSVPFSVAGRKGQSPGTPTNDTLATATPLSDITSAGLVQVPGAIGTDPYYSPMNSDPTAQNPADQVDMYGFTVSGPGRYLLTAEAFAGRIGSPLDPALTLFRITGTNADGTPTYQLVAGNDNSYNPTETSTGKLPLFTDPALFAGLTAGSYVIAVSATGNYADPLLGLKAGADGTFNPDKSHSGSTVSRTTGRYVLNLLVQPAPTTPPQVVQTSIAPGSVFSGPPTTFSVQFSVPVNLVQMAVQSGQQWQLNTFGGNVDPSALQRFPVSVQDGAGNRYVPALASYSDDTGLATFTMLGRLTDGSYTLHLSGPGGLSDLAGDPLAGNDPSGDYVVPFSVTGSPVRAANLVLTNPNDSFAAPTNLGVLFPTELTAGITIQRDFQSANPAPQDQADYYQFTLLQESGLVLSLGGPGVDVAGRPVLLDADGNPLYPAIDPNGPGRQTVNLILPAGTYVVEVGGWSPATAAKAVYTLCIVQDSLPENPTPLTTGPAPAVRLRLDTVVQSALIPNAALSTGGTPQLSLTSPGTPSITLTVDRSAASGVLPGATTTAGTAAGLAAGPTGVVGTSSTASSDMVRLVLPGSEFPVTAVATTELSAAPSAAGGSVTAGPMTGVIEAGIRAILFYSIEWLRMPQLMPRLLYLEPESAPLDESADIDEVAAVAEPADTRVADGSMAPVVWAAGMALVNRIHDREPDRGRRRRW
jgi:hypothetical protein